MKQLLPSLLLVLVWAALLCSVISLCAAQTPYPIGPDSRPQPGVPQGKTFQFDLTASTKYYPGAKSTVWVYVPAQYAPDKPACLCVGLDGPNYLPQTVFDNLIAKRQMPVTIGVFVSSGTVTKPGTDQPPRFDRCYEFDSTNDTFARFLLEEVLPAVGRRKTPDGRAIHISTDPNDHMIYGASSGGVCAFTAAWLRPDLFRRVFTAIGTYVGMRGADMYPTLVRKTEPKPSRIFLQDGSQDTWNPLFDNWYTQNRSMEESLSFAGYDVNHNWGTLGHEGSHAQSIFPDVVRWLWRDYPQPIEAGWSGNSMLRTILKRGEDWRPVAGAYRAATGLAVSPSGDVYFDDAVMGAIYRVGADGAASVFARSAVPLTAQAFGPDGRLYAATADGRLLAYTAPGKATAVAHGVYAHGIFVSSDGSIYATEPGAHDDVPSKIWLIRPNGSKRVIDTGLRHATGIIMTPDHNLLFAAEGRTHWVYSYVLQSDGTLQEKQRFYWLHTAESADDAGDGSDATDMAEDTQGDLYVATRMGVQVCDRNGRVEGILTLPPGQVTSLCFGGEHFGTLYIVCGGTIYRRTMLIPGVPGWAAPAPLPPFGAG
ncbi:MAG: SMP-30/gluconolactonase/LRE family protein [Armatimonadetes bacterium]|nr:SMP-30/gluconolactonase/LRE family protein [Armatimonadota bacterium]